MTLLDAYALIAFLVDEPAAGEVEALMRTGDTGVLVVNLAEALDVTQRVHGVSDAELRAVLEPLLGDVVAVVTQPAEAAWRAAELRAKHYNRRSSPLSLADCFLLAAAGDDEIATADRALATALRAAGASVVALPDSSGRRP